MSIYTKSVSQLTADDLRELVNDKAVENLRLEFKREVPDKDETLKKLSSFANTFGGLVIVGAAASSRDGRVDALPGVDEQSGYKQKVVDWCFNGANPPITAEVSDPIPTPDGNGKVCYVVSVAESDLAPHFLNGRQGVWIRTDEFSGRFHAALANAAELRELFSRRQVIVQRRAHLLERARQRYNTYISTAAKSRKLPENDDAILEVSILPRFPSRPVCEQERITTVVMQNRTEWRGIGFPNIGNNIISQHESTIVTQPMGLFSILEVNVWGLLFYGTEIEYERKVSEQVHISGIHVNTLVGIVLVYMRHAQQIFRALSYSGSLLIRTSLNSIRGVQRLQSLDGFFDTRDGSVLDDEVTFSIDSTTDELRERPDGVAISLLRNIFFSLNWPDLVSTMSFEDVIRGGYQFNNWPFPAVLRK